MAEEPVKTGHGPGGGTVAVRLARCIGIRATAVDGVA